MGSFSESNINCSKNEDGIFTVPKRRILVPQDVGNWLNSESYSELIIFLKSLNLAVKGVSQSQKREISQVLTH